jgi:hypothetical protein
MFEYGALGAIASLMIVQVLPWALAVTKGADVHITWLRCGGALPVICIFALAGGLVAYLVGDATAARQAVAYGLAWQGLVGGFLQGARAEKDEVGI